MNFLWGAATSSHQIEGQNRNNDWWEWEAQGKIEGGVRSGAATDHWNRFRADLGLAAGLGLNAYRFSVEWSRVEPEEGRFDADAIAWYAALVDECERLGLEPMVTLHHFTLPRWLAKKGGFTCEAAPELFARYTEKVAAALGPRVRLWCTLNEPMVLVIGSYLGKFMPPAVFSPELAAQACSQMLKCHVAAYDLLHSLPLPPDGGPRQVGFAHNLIDILPDRSWHPLERLLAYFVHRFYNRAWLDALTGRSQNFGVPGLVPRAPEVKSALGRKTIDYLGLNYYTKAYVQWRPRDRDASNLGAPELPIGFSFSRRTDPVSDLGWAIHPEGFSKMLRFAGSYGLPIYVTENGIADHQDRLRPDYLVSHLAQVAKAIESGIDVRGYFHWSLLDNFEWVKGFKPRFGLYRVDYETFEREETGTARLYRALIEAHRGAPGWAPSSAIIGQVVQQALTGPR